MVRAIIVLILSTVVLVMVTIPGEPLDVSEGSFVHAGASLEVWECPSLSLANNHGKASPITERFLSISIT
jgi:hypothetical protein